jgi:hypothetical protein
VDSDAFWTVSAIQYDPDKKLNVMLEFYLIGIDFQAPTEGRPAWEFQQNITVRLKQESEIPYGFYWDDKRGRVDVRSLPQL